MYTRRVTGRETTGRKHRKTRNVCAAREGLMDVILDSNVYLSDIRMESIRFKNLFDYLRRTRSLLVIPRLVREEVVAKYVNMLEQQAKKTAESIRAFNRMTLTSNDEIHFHSPNPKYEARDLRKKLRAPAKKIAPLMYMDVDGIDLTEVFMRGIKRRRPASDDGEELRDVILWFLVLQYARSNHKSVGFITADKGFWNAESVHDHISEDIEKSDGKVGLFRSIEDFIKSNSPVPKNIDPAEVSKFFQINAVSDVIIDRAKEALSARTGRYAAFGIYGTVQSTKLTTADLQEANLYEITPDASLAELSYAFTLVADVARPAEDFAQAFNRIALASQQAGPLARLSSYGTPDPSTWVFGNMAPAREGIFVGRATPEASEVRSYVANGRASVSVRLVGEKCSEIEVERVEILRVEEMKNAIA